MAVFIFALFALIQFVLMAWTLQLYSRRPGPERAIIALITAGLVYDNAVIAFGGMLGIGSTLQAASIPRFVIHALLTPCLLLATLELAHQAGVTISARAKRATWVITGILIVIGFVQGVFGAHLLPACYGGTIRYTERVAESQLCPDFSYTETELTARGIPPIAAVGTIVLAGFMAFVIGRKSGYWMLFAGLITMFIAAAIPASRVGPAVSNGGEVVMMLGFVLTTAAFQKRLLPKLAAA